MTKYIVRRIVIALLLILAIAVIVFVMLRIAIPGDPAEILAGDRASPQLVAQIRANLGLDRSVPEQLWIFLTHALTGDLGRSVRFNLPVFDLIIGAFPYTAVLAFGSVTVGTTIGLTVGTITAIKRHTWVDHIAMVLVVFFYSVPTFWMGLMLILIFAVGLRVLPVQGTGSWQNFVLPIATLSLGQTALIARLTRANMIETLNAAYIQTGRSKGLSERRIILMHALRNTLIPIITIVGLSIGGLLGGAVITESIFGIPGVGRLAIDAILDRDYPMVQGTVLLVAGAFVFMNLVVDVLYVYVDPRIRYD
ncbi:MAG TPA: ABC transporter permease [Phototrophicaceae bacterium]|nr:ABC transporter permease [Phototrophicaceae bacterium]